MRIVSLEEMGKWPLPQSIRAIASCLNSFPSYVKVGDNGEIGTITREGKPGPGPQIFVTQASENVYDDQLKVLLIGG